MSKSHSSWIAAAVVLAIVPLAANVPVAAHDQAPSGQTATALKTPVPLKVDVVISRFLADKKVSSAPFTLWVSAMDARIDRSYVSIRMGIDVPIGSRSQTSNTTTTQRPEYRHVGTSIDSRATLLDDGRFSVEVSVQDSSIFTGTTTDAMAAFKVSDPLAFRSFQMNNTLSIRSGQTVEYSTATDRITGEVVKVEVTATVVK